MYLDDGQSFQYRDNTDYNYISIDIEDDIVTFNQIDVTNGNYDFKVDQVIKKEIIKPGSKDQAGIHKETVYKQTSNGQLLENVKISTKEKTVLLLKQ